MTADPATASIPHQSLASLFARFLRFGALAWGGPVAQIAMLRRELVEREGWIGSERFNRTLAVYQALPGPEAHELAVYFGYLARGRLGGMLAGLGFMLPGLLLMLLVAWAYVTVGIGSPLAQAFFAGCQAAVLALIVRAVHRIGLHAVTDRSLLMIALASFTAGLLGLHFALVLLAAGLASMLAGRAPLAAVGLLVLVVAVAIWGSAPAADRQVLASESQDTRTGAVAPDELLVAGLRAGLLTFGGAYTAIPFLEQDAVRGGWMSRETFLDGVALAGLLPAPLVIFATFMGFVGGGPVGALAITVGVFAPAFAMTLVGHRQLERLVTFQPVHALLDGVTAGVVGLVAATTLALAPAALPEPLSAVIALGAVIALYRWQASWTVAAVVIGAGAAGTVLFALLPSLIT